MKFTLNLYIIFLSIFIFSYCNLKNEENKEKELLLQQLLNTNNCNTYNLSSMPTFTELQNQGVFNSCIQCHNALRLDGNLNLQDYEQTRSRVVPYNPQNSLLYQKITTGTMKSYSNDCINEAIRKWIEAGAEYQKQKIDYLEPYLK